MRTGLSSPILNGLILMLIIVLLGSVIVSLVFQFTSVSESKMPIFTYVVNAISLLIGGFVSGLKAKERGWFYGGMTGILYTVILLLIAFLAFDVSFTVKSLVTMISAFGTAAIGGIFGVNFSR